MKQSLVLVMLAVLAVALCAPPAFAQATTTVKGTARDMGGKPYAGAVVEFISKETGRKYTLKTNKNGEYFSLGVAGGKYDLSLQVDGKEIYRLSNVNVSLQQEENKIDIDLKKEQSAQQQQMSPEERKKIEEQQAKAQKEALNVKSLNDKLAGARAAMLANNFDQAVQLMTESTQIDPNRDLIWFTLGDAYRGQARNLEKTDKAAAKASFQQAADAYQKAIAIKPLAAYYNNMADVFAKSGNVDEAVKAYNQAAALDATSAGQYQYNIGAVYTNAGRVDEAVTAFKAAIAADPAKADAYYWLGVNMMGKATLKGDKMTAPDGTAEAFQKYLELAPTGQFAQPAKDMLATIGSSIETSFGKQKKPTKK